jgi:hypothetical protein
LISMYGHTYLMSNIIENLYSYEKLISEKDIEASRKESSSEELTNGGVQALYQFVNSVDIDFSTPLIYSLRNKKNHIVRILLKNEKICL